MNSDISVKDLICGEYPHCVKSMEDISRDTANEEVMVTLRDRCHSYDEIAKLFYQGQVAQTANSKKDKEKLPSTPDMLLFKKDAVVFVEFKNGEINRKVRKEIKVKAIEGGFIVLYDIIRNLDDTVTFTDILTKVRKEFVLVYSNTGKNGKRGKKHAATRQWYKDHYGAAPIRFNLRIYEGTFFSQVQTITGPEFKQWYQEQDFLRFDAPAEKTGTTPEEVTGNG